MSFMNKSFANMTAIPRKIGVLPEDMSSPQRAVDQVRGKRRIKGGSVFARSFQRSTRSSSFGQQAEQGQHLTL